MRALCVFFVFRKRVSPKMFNCCCFNFGEGNQHSGWSPVGSSEPEKLAHVIKKSFADRRGQAKGKSAAWLEPQKHQIIWDLPGTKTRTCQGTTKPDGLVKHTKAQRKHILLKSPPSGSASLSWGRPGGVTFQKLHIKGRILDLRQEIQIPWVFSQKAFGAQTETHHEWLVWSEP